jgi:serine phosphatase RsbU (regulator of sigma subunit)/Tfp pilus assembly protein PilF
LNQLAAAYNNMGMGYFYQEEYTEALKNLDQALDLYTSLGNDEELVRILENLASTYYSLGLTDAAIEHWLRALALAENLGDRLKVGTMLLNMGITYSELEDKQDSALYYYSRAIELGESMGNTELMGAVYRNKGIRFATEEVYDSALYNFDRSLVLLNSSYDITSVLTSKGNIYLETGDYENATLFFNDATHMAEKDSIQWMQAGILLGLAHVSEKQNQHTQAIAYYNQAELIASEYELNQELSRIYQGLALTYAELDDFTNAYKYLSKQNDLDSTIKKTEAGNQALNLVNTYQLDKKQIEIEILKQRSEIEQLKDRRQRAMMLASGLFGILLLATVLGLNNRMNFIRRTNEKIKDQKNLITDSISYAQRIQTALLPSRELMDTVMPEYFVILKPKDIVSGDFYWIKEVQDHLVIVGADCTGHGVPGAFMSMLGITLLNDLIGDRCYDAPCDILEQLRMKLKEMLWHEGDLHEQKDGMDMALAILNKSTRELHYAGANAPLYLIRDRSMGDNGELEAYASTGNNDYQLYEFKGDKQPIGMHWDERSFTNHSIPLKENDSFYIFSDGYVDQFGGKHRKKFKSRNFKRLLLSLQDKSMEHQKRILDDTFKVWKGDVEQIDDVSVIGVRV